MILTVAHKVQEVIFHSHILVVEKEVRVKRALKAQFTTKVRLSLVYVITELLTRTHSVNELRSDELRCILRSLRSHCYLDDFSSK